VELVYLTNAGRDFHAMSPLVSWVIVLGAVYGCLRLIRDLLRLLRYIALGERARNPPDPGP
jgi:hypothetical protein